MLPSILSVSAALLLLWLPRRWLRLGKTLWRRKRSRLIQEPWARRERGDPRLSFWEEFGKVRNWVDLLRGTAGSLALLGEHGIGWMIGSEAPRGAVTVLAVQSAILFVGLMIQTVRKESGHMTFFAPVFYLAGTAVGLCGGWPVLFGFVLVWAVNPMLPSAVAFLMVQGIALAGFGLLLRGIGDIRPAIAALLCLTPAMLSLLFRRPLVVFSHKSPTNGTAST